MPTSRVLKCYNRNMTEVASARIPKLRNTEGIKKVDINNRDVKNLLADVSKTCLDINFHREFTVLEVFMLHNSELQEAYVRRRAEMKEEGRGSQTLIDQLGFIHLLPDERSKLHRLGLLTRYLPYNRLGKSQLGIYLNRFFDVEVKHSWLNGDNKDIQEIAVVKYFPGKCKPLNIGNASYKKSSVEPTPNYDSHVSTVAPSLDEGIFLQKAKSEIYLYEYDEECEPSRRPRQCLPYALIKIKRKPLPPKIAPPVPLPPAANTAPATSSTPAGEAPTPSTAAVTSSTKTEQSSLKESRPCKSDATEKDKSVQKEDKPAKKALCVDEAEVRKREEMRNSYLQRLNFAKASVQARQSKELGSCQFFPEFSPSQSVVQAKLLKTSATQGAAVNTDQLGETFARTLLDPSSSNGPLIQSNNPLNKPALGQSLQSSSLSAQNVTALSALSCGPGKRIDPRLARSGSNPVTTTGANTRPDPRLLRLSAEDRQMTEMSSQHASKPLTANNGHRPLSLPSKSALSNGGSSLGEFKKKMSYSEYKKLKKDIQAKDALPLSDCVPSQTASNLQVASSSTCQPSALPMPITLMDKSKLPPKPSTPEKDVAEANKRVPLPSFYTEYTPDTNPLPPEVDFDQFQAPALETVKISSPQAKTSVVSKKPFLPLPVINPDGSVSNVLRGIVNGNVKEIKPPVQASPSMTASNKLLIKPELVKNMAKNLVRSVSNISETVLQQEKTSLRDGGVADKNVGNKVKRKEEGVNSREEHHRKALGEATIKRPVSARGEIDEKTVKDLLEGYHLKEQTLANDCQEAKASISSRNSGTQSEPKLSEEAELASKSATNSTSFKTEKADCKDNMKKQQDGDRRETIAADKELTSQTADAESLENKSCTANQAKKPKVTEKNLTPGSDNSSRRDKRNVEDRKQGDAELREKEHPANEVSTVKKLPSNVKLIQSAPPLPLIPFLVSDDKHNSNQSERYVEQLKEKQELNLGVVASECEEVNQTETVASLTQTATEGSPEFTPFDTLSTGTWLAPSIDDLPPTSAVFTKSCQSSESVALASNNKHKNTHVEGESSEHLSSQCEDRLLTEQERGATALKLSDTVTDKIHPDTILSVLDGKTTSDQPFSTQAFNTKSSKTADHQKKRQQPLNTVLSVSEAGCVSGESNKTQTEEDQPNHAADEDAQPQAESAPSLTLRELGFIDTLHVMNSLKFQPSTMVVDCTEAMNENYPVNTCRTCKDLLPPESLKYMNAISDTESHSETEDSEETASESFSHLNEIHTRDFRDKDSDGTSCSEKQKSSTSASGGKKYTDSRIKASETKSEDDRELLSVKATAACLPNMETPDLKAPQLVDPSDGDDKVAESEAKRATECPPYKEARQEGIITSAASNTGVSVGQEKRASIDNGLQTKAKDQIAECSSVFEPKKSLVGGELSLERKTGNTSDLVVKDTHVSNLTSTGIEESTAGLTRAHCSAYTLEAALKSVASSKTLDRKNSPANSAPSALGGLPTDSTIQAADRQKVQEISHDNTGSKESLAQDQTHDLVTESNNKIVDSSCAADFEWKEKVENKGPALECSKRIELERILKQKEQRRGILIQVLMQKEKMQRHLEHDIRKGKYEQDLLTLEQKDNKAENEIDTAKNNQDEKGCGNHSKSVKVDEIVHKKVIETKENHVPYKIENSKESGTSEKPEMQVQQTSGSQQQEVQDVENQANSPESYRKKNVSLKQIELSSKSEEIGKQADSIEARSKLESDTSETVEGEGILKSDKCEKRTGQVGGKPMKEFSLSDQRRERSETVSRDKRHKIFSADDKARSRHSRRERERTPERSSSERRSHNRRRERSREDRRDRDRRERYKRYDSEKEKKLDSAKENFRDRDRREERSRNGLKTQYGMGDRENDMKRRKVSDYIPKGSLKESFEQRHQDIKRTEGMMNKKLNKEMEKGNEYEEQVEQRANRSVTASEQTQINETMPQNCEKEAMNKDTENFTEWTEKGTERGECYTQSDKNGNLLTATPSHQTCGAVYSQVSSSSENTVVPSDLGLSEKPGSLLHPLSPIVSAAKKSMAPEEGLGDGSDDEFGAPKKLIQPVKKKIVIKLPSSAQKGAATEEAAVARELDSTPSLPIFPTDVTPASTSQPSSQVDSHEVSPAASLSNSSMSMESSTVSQSTHAKNNIDQVLSITVPKASSPEKPCDELYSPSNPTTEDQSNLAIIYPDSSQSDARLDETNQTLNEDHGSYRDVYTASQEKPSCSASQISRNRNIFSLYPTPDLSEPMPEAPDSNEYGDIDYRQSNPPSSDQVPLWKKNSVHGDKSGLQRYEERPYCEDIPENSLPYWDDNYFPYKETYHDVRGQQAGYWKGAENSVPFDYGDSDYRQQPKPVSSCPEEPYSQSFVKPGQQYERINSPRSRLYHDMPFNKSSDVSLWNSRYDIDLRPRTESRSNASFNRVDHWSHFTVNNAGLETQSSTHYPAQEQSDLFSKNSNTWCDSELENTATSERADNETSATLKKMLPEMFSPASHKQKCQSILKAFSNCKTSLSRQVVLPYENDGEDVYGNHEEANLEHRRKLFAKVSPLRQLSDTELQKDTSSDVSTVEKLKEILENVKKNEELPVIDKTPKADSSSYCQATDQDVVPEKRSVPSTVNEDVGEVHANSTADTLENSTKSQVLSLLPVDMTTKIPEQASPPIKVDTAQFIQSVGHLDQLVKKINTAGTSLQNLSTVDELKQIVDNLTKKIYASVSEGDSKPAADSDAQDSPKALPISSQPLSSGVQPVSPMSEEKQPCDAALSDKDLISSPESPCALSDKARSAPDSSGSRQTSSKLSLVEYGGSESEGDNEGTSDLSHSFIEDNICDKNQSVQSVKKNSDGLNVLKSNSSTTVFEKNTSAAEEAKPKSFTTRPEFKKCLDSKNECSAAEQYPVESVQSSTELQKDTGPEKFSEAVFVKEAACENKDKNGSNKSENKPSQSSDSSTIVIDSPASSACESPAVSAPVKSNSSLSINVRDECKVYLSDVPMDVLSFARDKILHEINELVDGGSDNVSLCRPEESKKPSESFENQELENDTDHTTEDGEIKEDEDDVSDVTLCPDERDIVLNISDLDKSFEHKASSGTPRKVDGKSDLTALNASRKPPTKHTQKDEEVIAVSSESESSYPVQPKETKRRTKRGVFCKKNPSALTLSPTLIETCKKKMRKKRKRRRKVESTEKEFTIPEKDTQFSDISGGSLNSDDSDNQLSRVTLSPNKSKAQVMDQNFLVHMGKKRKYSGSPVKFNNTSEMDKSSRDKRIIRLTPTKTLNPQDHFDIRGESDSLSEIIDFPSAAETEKHKALSQHKEKYSALPTTSKSKDTKRRVVQSKDSGLEGTKSNFTWAFDLKKQDKSHSYKPSQNKLQKATSLELEKDGNRNRDSCSSPEPKKRIMSKVSKVVISPEDSRRVKHRGSRSMSKDSSKKDSSSTSPPEPLSSVKRNSPEPSRHGKARDSRSTSKDHYRRDGRGSPHDQPGSSRNSPGDLRSQRHRRRRSSSADRSRKEASPASKEGNSPELSSRRKRSPGRYRERSRQSRSVSRGHGRRCYSRSSSHSPDRWRSHRESTSSYSRDNYSPAERRKLGQYRRDASPSHTRERAVYYSNDRAKYRSSPSVSPDRAIIVKRRNSNRSTGSSNERSPPPRKRFNNELDYYTSRQPYRGKSPVWKDLPSYSFGARSSTDKSTSEMTTTKSIDHIGLDYFTTRKHKDNVQNTVMDDTDDKRVVELLSPERELSDFEKLMRDHEKERYRKQNPNNVTIEQLIITHFGSVIPEHIREAFPFPLNTSITHDSKGNLRPEEDRYDFGNKIVEAFGLAMALPHKLVDTANLNFCSKCFDKEPCEKRLEEFSDNQILLEVNVIKQCQAFLHSQGSDLPESSQSELMLQIKTIEQAELQAGILLFKEKEDGDSTQSLAEMEKKLAAVKEECELLMRACVKDKQLKACKDKRSSDIPVSDMPEELRVPTSGFEFRKPSHPMLQGNVKSDLEALLDQVAGDILELYKCPHFGRAHFRIPDLLLLSAEKNSLYGMCGTPLILNTPIPQSSFISLLSLRQGLEAMGPEGRDSPEGKKLLAERSKVLANLVDGMKRTGLNKLKTRVRQFDCCSDYLYEVLGSGGLKKLAVFETYQQALQWHYKFFNEECGKSSKNIGFEKFQVEHDNRVASLHYINVPV